MYGHQGDGTLAYMGGIDDKPLDQARGPQGREELCRPSADEIAAGKPSRTPTARLRLSVKFSS
jgi:hypothetical protein